MRKPSRLVVVLACLAFAAPVWGQSKAEWKFGDVFVAIDSGSYEVIHSNDNGLTYVSEGNITNGHTPGTTAGCASDATFHLLTTDYAVTGFTTGAVDRWAMNADPGVAHNVIQTLSIPAGSSNPTSVVVDAMGNLYTGTADGKGLIVEYPLSNGAYSTPVKLPLGVSTISGGTAWIDLSATGAAMYFTNGGKKVNWFPVAGINPTISSSNFGLTNTHFFGLRVVPSGTYANDLLVAAGANIYLFNPADGSIVKTYTVSNESNFEFVTLDPNTSGATSFWAGNPATNHFYRINLSTGTVENGPFASSGTVSGICAYGDFHANQVQPVSLGAAQHPDANDTVRFASPFDGDNTTALKVTFSAAPSGTTLPASLSGLSVSGVVSAIDPAAGYSDAIPSSNNFPASGPLACTPDTAVSGGKCLVWVLDDNTDPTGTTPPPYSAANYAFAQAGADGNTRLIRDGDSDITWLVSNLDPGGQTRGTSGYSLNEIPASQTPDSFCGYSSPVGKNTYNFGSAVPFKFSAATSLANCASGKTVTNLKSQFGAPFLLLWQQPLQVNSVNVSAGNPVDDVRVSGQSGVPPIYRPTGGGYILNLKTDSLTPGACYIATTFANQIPAAAVSFCLN